MEHLYTVHTKLLQDKTYYFVKKIMAIPELNGLADVVVGYGMHTDFEKACNIAGIDDIDCRKKLLLELEEGKQPTGKEGKPEKTAVRRHIHIADSVNRWLAQRGVELLN